MRRLVDLVIAMFLYIAKNKSFSAVRSIQAKLSSKNKRSPTSRNWRRETKTTSKEMHKAVRGKYAHRKVWNMVSLAARKLNGSNIYTKKSSL